MRSARASARFPPPGSDIAAAPFKPIGLLLAAPLDADGLLFGAPVNLPGTLFAALVDPPCLLCCLNPAGHFLVVSALRRGAF